MIIAAMILPPTAQPAEYHRFADQRNFFGIPNFNDVISNLAFLLSGGAGLVFLWRIHGNPTQTAFQDRKESWPYWVLFLSITSVAFGSIHYHWAPESIIYCGTGYPSSSPSPRCYRPRWLNA